jgi:FKBP-type peptidyl-prolyl cis-trans isomerase
MCEFGPPRRSVHAVPVTPRSLFMSRATTLIAALALIALAGCQATTGGHSSAGTTTTSSASSGAKPTTAAPAQPTVVTLPDGLKYQDLTIGDGAIAESGLEASVHCTGWLQDGTKFYSTEGGSPLTFRLGAGQVIAGWEEGVRGMRVGGRRKLTIPPELGYGEAGRGSTIPPNSTLIFDIELLGLR